MSVKSCVADCHACLKSFVTFGRLLIFDATRGRIYCSFFSLFILTQDSGIESFHNDKIYKITFPQAKPRELLQLLAVQYYGGEIVSYPKL